MTIPDPSSAGMVGSPCIGECRLDARQLCTGCRRHISEIVEWSRASPARRLEIRRAAELRSAALTQL